MVEVVINTDSIGRCESNFHTISASIVPIFYVHRKLNSRLILFFSLGLLQGIEYNGLLHSSYKTF
jgi:hypothetical protein